MSGILHDLNKFDQNINFLLRNEFEMETEEICIDMNMKRAPPGDCQLVYTFGPPLMVKT